MYIILFLTRGNELCKSTLDIRGRNCFFLETLVSLSNTEMPFIEIFIDSRLIKTFAPSLILNRGITFLCEPAALLVFPGVVPDSSVRGSGGFLVSPGETSESCGARGAGPVRAATAPQVVWTECSAV